MDSRRRTSAMSLALIACGLVRAADSGVDAHQLGVADAIVSYCAAVDAAAAARLKGMVQEIVRGASEQQLAETRKSEAYHSAYDSMVDFTDRIDPHNAQRFCTETSTAHK